MNNPPPDNIPSQGTADAGRQDSGPANWRESLMTLIASRIALIQFEALNAAKQRARRLAGMFVAAICLIFTWALLLAGGIAAISAATGCAWHWLAIGAAGSHLLLALLVLASVSANSSAPAFPLSRAEFQKDREWIENFHKKPK